MVNAQISRGGVVIKWVMAIDVGRKKTGVAVGQMITRTARPVTIIHQNLGKLHASAFKDIVLQWQIDAIVIGLPSLKDGNKHPLADGIARLGEECRLEFSLPVFYSEEYLTSHEARKRQPKGKYLDAVAAAIIAEDWMAEYDG